MSAAKPYKWTTTRIRAATPFPKPTGELSRVVKAFNAATVDGSWILQHIAKHADLIHDDKSLNNHRDFEVDRASVLPPYWPPSIGFVHHGDWLLVPVSPNMLEALAEIGASTEDLENTGDDEPDADAEPDDEDEEHDGREPEDYVGGLSEPVIAASDERPAVPVTAHTDMSEWRKI